MWTHAKTIKRFNRADGRARLYILARNDGLYEYRAEEEVVGDEREGIYWAPTAMSGLYATAEEVERGAIADVLWARASQEDVTECPWETIKQFVSTREVRSFETWMQEQIGQGRASEIERPNDDNQVIPEGRYFEHLASGKRWVLNFAGERFGPGFRSIDDE